MQSMATKSALDPKLLIKVLENHRGEYPFESVLGELKLSGLPEAEARELIWQVLALGQIEFSLDRSALHLRADLRLDPKAKVA